MGDNRTQYFLTYEGRTEVLAEAERVLVELRAAAKNCPSDGIWFLIRQQNVIVSRLQYQTQLMRETLQTLMTSTASDPIQEMLDHDDPF